MKNKFAVIFFAVLYFIASTGVSAHLHFCGGVIAGISLINPLPKDVCGCAIDEKVMDCCTDEVAFYKVDTKHTPVNTAAKVPSTKLAPFIIAQPLQINFAMLDNTQLNPIDKKGLDPPLRILLCVFII